MLNQRSDKVELLRIAEAVAAEKSIDAEIILSSMELAIQKAAKTKFGSENDIRATIDRENGNISLHKVLTIVESPENLDTEISLEHAKKIQNKEKLNVNVAIPKGCTPGTLINFQVKNRNFRFKCPDDKKPGDVVNLVIKL